MNKKSILCAVFITTLFLTHNAFSQIQAIAVVGKVAYKQGNQWKPLTKGQIIVKGTSISTGFRSWALFQINGKSFLRVKPLTQLQIFGNSYNKDNKSYTHIGLSRGSIRAKIHKYKFKKVDTIFKVSTPVATSSVRGTEEDITYGPIIGMIIRVIDGEIIGQGRNGNKSAISKKLVFVKKNGMPNQLPLISRISNKSLITIHDQNITIDESSSNNFNSGDIINTTDGSVSTFDSDIKNTDRTKLNVYVNWPNK